MKIKEIYIDAFGCIEKTKRSFENGLNIITKDNELGKTTTAEFIKAMLYGIGGNYKNIKDNVRKKYMPWGKNEMGGELRLEHNGIQYLIARRFGKKRADDTVTVINAVSGERLLALCTNEPGFEITGVGKDAFEKALFISSFHIDMGAGRDEITDRLIALQQSGDEEVSYKSACDILNKAINELSSARSGKIKYEKEKLEQLTEKLQKENLMQKKRENIELKLGERKNSRPKQKYTAAFAVPLALISLFCFCMVKNILLGCLFAAAAVIVITAAAYKKISENTENSNISQLEEIISELPEVNPQKTREDINACKGRILKYNEKLNKLNEAKRCLDEAFTRLQQGFGTELNKNAREILSVVTRGKYSEVKVDKNFEMTVRSQNGWYSAQYLSSGAYDQIYFSLKCAVIKMLFGDMPVILDDAFVRYDKQRQSRALEYLSNIENQVILFSCR